MRRGRGNGRNNYGRITVGGRGGGSKRKIREVSVTYGPGMCVLLEREEYDSNRSGAVGICIDEVGVRRRILLASEMRTGERYSSVWGEYRERDGEEQELRNVDIGRRVCAIGGVYSRSGGGFGIVLSEKSVRLKSGNVVNVKGLVRLGTMGLGISSMKERRCAGSSRRAGCRPRVRRVAMNAVDR